MTRPIPPRGSAVLDRAAIRGSVALRVHPPGEILQVTGPGAWDALDRLLPCDLALRDGQGRHTLLVGDDGAAEADVVVIADEDCHWLLFDGLAADVVAGRVREAAAGVLEVSDPGLTRVELAGPFAWELAAKVVGPGVIGLPYLELREGPIEPLRAGSARPRLRCLRGGRTGEYGYELLVPHAEVPVLRERLLDLGQALDLREVASLDDAALENAFWVPGTPGLEGLDPIELQLQWRLAWDKEWRGSDVLRERRRQGVARRITAFRSASAAAGSQVRLGEAVVGRVRVVRPAPTPQVLGPDPTGEGVIGYALVDVDLAHPGLPGLLADGVALDLISPPFVVNLSLLVKPQRHRYANRGELARP